MFLKITIFNFVIAILSYDTGLKAQSVEFEWVNQTSGIINKTDKIIKIDQVGNVYSTGYFNGTIDLDPSENEFNLYCNDTSASIPDIFIRKLDASGNFIWGKQIGGLSADYSESIALDEVGNIYLFGTFFGTSDFDPSIETYNLTASAIYDAFILKLDVNGNFIWVNSIASDSAIQANSILTDNAGNIFATGSFTGTVDFDSSEDIFELNSSGENDVFILKLNSEGNFIWAEKMGGLGDDLIYSFALDENNNLYTTGSFNGTADFNPKFGEYNLTAFGYQDIFISKLDQNGNFLWAKTIGGLGNDYFESMKIDIFGNVYLTGSLSNTIDFDPGPEGFNLTPDGNYDDMYILKLNYNGDFEWVKSIKGEFFNRSNSIDVDIFGNCYITGRFALVADFDPGADVYNLTSSTVADFFILKLDLQGNFLWVIPFGTESGGGEGKWISIDSSNNIYLMGSFKPDTDFDPGPEVENLIAVIPYPSFILKLSQSDLVYINERENKSFINIYPNPSSGLFTIDLKEKSVLTITNILGETLLQQEFEAGKQNINIQDEANGIYFVRIFSNGEMGMVKILKE